MERGRERSSTARELEREEREGLEAGAVVSEGSVVCGGFWEARRELSAPPALFRGGIECGCMRGWVMVRGGKRCESGMGGESNEGNERE